MNRVSVGKKALTAALATLCRIVPSRSSNPVLTAGHLRLHDGVLTLTGTDLDTAVGVTVPADVALGTADDAFLFPAHLLDQLARNAPTATVDLLWDPSGRELTLQGGTHGTSLQINRDTGGFPELTFEHGPHAHTLEHADLARALSHVEYAASPNAFQAPFRGVRLELTPDRTRFVASDGYRLVYETLPALTTATHAAHLLIPARSIPALLNALKTLPADAPVTLSLLGGFLNVTAPQVALRLKLMDQDYPDYTRVIPATTTRTITVQAEHLTGLVNRVALLTDEGSNYRMEFTSDGDRFTAHAENEYGRVEDTIAAHTTGTNPTGPFHMGINARMFREALAGRAGEVQLHVTDALKPLVITDSTHPEHRAVLVPLREV